MRWNSRGVDRFGIFVHCGIARGRFANSCSENSFAPAFVHAFQSTFGLGNCRSETRNFVGSATAAIGFDDQSQGIVVRSFQFVTFNKIESQKI